MRLRLYNFWFDIPMLDVFCGPFHPALEDAFVRRLGDLKAKDPLSPVIVAAPSRRMADRLERLLAVERGQGLVNVRFHTFFSLALSVLDDGGFPDGSVVSDPVFFDRLLDAVLDEIPGIAAAFGGHARPKAMARSLRASLRDLTDAGADGAQILDHFGEDIKDGPRARRRLFHLLGLGARYETRVESLGVLSSSSLTKAASRRALDGGGYLGRFSEIIYYGFYDLTGVQADFFEAVAANYTASLFFPYRKDHPAFRFASAFFDQKVMGLARSIQNLDPDVGKTALGPALNHLFAETSAAAAVPEQNLRLMNASGERGEIWACAKEIASLVRSGVCRYEDVGVIARGLDRYRAAAVEIFADNAIPIYLDADEPLLRRPLARTVWNLLSAGRRDFSARLITDVFSSPYFHPQAGGRGHGARRSWRLLIERLQIRAGWLQWEGKLREQSRADIVFERADEEPIIVAREDAASLWKFVSELRDLWSRPLESWRDAASRARDVVGRFLAEPEVSDPERPAWEQINAILTSLEGFDRMGASPSWQDVLDVLEEKFRRSRLSPRGSGRSVRVLDAMGARGESFKIVFLIGLREKSFPREIREDPILRDSDRAFLRHPIGCWMGLKSAGYDEEKLLFYLAAASAKRTLYAVWPRSDEDGKVESPSYYLLRLCRAAGRPWDEAIVYRRAARSPGLRAAQCATEDLTPREFSLRLALSGQNPAQYLSVPGYAQNDFGLERIWPFLPAFCSWGPPGAWDGLVNPPEIFLRELSRRGLSPSAFEILQNCSFRFFAERVLRLGSGEEAAERDEMSASVRGLVYHKILEIFYRESAGGADAGAVSGENRDWEKRLMSAIEAVFLKKTWRVLGLYPLLWEAQKRAMSAHLRDFLAWDLARNKENGFRPRRDLLEKELRAPFPSGLPEGLSGLFLRGRIDRADADSSGRLFDLADYKTKLTDRVKKNKNIQLSFYAELARAYLGDSGRIKSARVLGVEASPSGEREAEISGDDLENGREAFWAEAARALRALSQGRFPIRPDDQGGGAFGHCSWCAFPAVCRKNHGPSRTRAESARKEC
ncbi:MAG: PD-(D/E)XK nuclease family protein [Elusimicrobiota bacterium]